MKDFAVKDYSALADVLFNDALRSKSSVAVLFYDEAIEIIKSLVSNPRVVINSINIDPPDWDNYDKEYLICIDSTLELFVEPAWRDSSEYNSAGYIIVGGDNMYIDSNANHEIIKKSDCLECYIIKEISDDSIYSYYNNRLKCESANKSKEESKSDLEMEITFDSDHRNPIGFFESYLFLL